MKTYQEYEAESNKNNFIVAAINEHLNSAVYKEAQTAQSYYARNNVGITKRLSFFQKLDKNVSAHIHRLSSGYFPRFVKKQTQYLLSNGVTFEDETIKDKLGISFDQALQKMTISCLVDGVAYGYWNVDKLVHFRVTEFVPILDEMTSELKLGIRFWRLAMDKPMYAEIYTLEGVRTVKIVNNEVKEVKPLEAYNKSIYKDGVSTIQVAASNYDRLPIIPMYANDLKTSELTKGFKSLIDAYDYTMSDLFEQIGNIEGVYWIVKNFGGEDLKTLVAEITQLKVTATDDQDTGVDNYNIEAPYAGKLQALELIEQRIYQDELMPDTNISGRAVTATEIKASLADLDIKCDMLEWNVAEFVKGVLSLLGVIDVEPVFKRRTLLNDQEAIANIYAARQDIDQETALRLNPTIEDNMVVEIMKRTELESTARLTPPEVI